MKVLIVSNYFWPENFRINDLATGLKDRGHDVTVLTGIPNYPEGKFFEGYGVGKPGEETFDGVKIIRSPLIPRGKGGPLTLALNYISSAISFCLKATIISKKKFDLIFVFEISPVTVGLPAIVIKKLQNIPIVFWVLDLWPESLEATGAVKSSKIIGFTRKLVRYIYSQCDRLLVSSKAYKKSVIETGGFNNDIDFFPNWVEPEYIEQEPTESPHKLPNFPSGFRIMFAGNIGAAQDFPTILKAAEILKGYQDIHWLIIGNGRKSDWVKMRVEEIGLTPQFHLLGQYPAEMMTSFFNQADAMLLTLKREQIFSLTVPGKLQSYMAAGKPIVVGMDGEAASLVQEAGAGLTCPAEDPAELAKTVLKVYQMSPEKRREMGECGRVYCSHHFDRQKLFDKLEGIMREVKANSE